MIPRSFQAIPPGMSALPQDLLALLAQRAAQHPTRVAVCDLGRDCEATKSLTYAELLTKAAGTARQLELQGWAGRPVLLAATSPTDFLTAFYGMLAAGSAPIPVSMGNSSRAGNRLVHIASDADAAGMIVDSSLASRAGDMLRGVADSPPLAILSPRNVSEPKLCAGDPKRLAFLQYTSGSTSQPRGVRISHANLLHNMACVSQAMDLIGGGTIVSWLPLHHDMGLIGMTLLAQFQGGTAALMRPVDFITRPLRWAQAITRHKAQFTGGPNLGLELLLRAARAKGVEGLDLSTLRGIANGAEPVRAETLHACREVLGPAGLGEDIIVPCYGLAESTLIASGSSGIRHSILHADAEELDAGTLTESLPGKETRDLVSCGGSLGHQEILIVNHKTRALCAEGEVGEIWLRGESVSEGYLNGDTESFHQTTASGESDCLRTGDLGALLDGNLYITGRLKDLIVIAGRNLHPTDLEWVAERAHPNLKPGSTAAFGVETDEGEAPVILIETDGKASFEEICSQVTAEITAEFDCTPKEIIEVERGSIPRTTSGKVRRNTCKENYLANQTNHLSESGKIS